MQLLSSQMNSFIEKFRLMKKLKSQLRIPCNSSSVNVDFWTQPQALGLKRVPAQDIY